MGDERKIKQVLLKLLSNAIKFTPEGGQIRLKAARRDGAVEIAVTDTGIGIAPGDRAGIFEGRWRRGSSSCTEDGSGFTFTFTLPVK